MPKVLKMSNNLDFWTHRLETCDPTELDQLLNQVQRENPSMAALLRSRILNFERIVKFYSHELAKFFETLNFEEQLALFHTIRAGERQEFESYLDETKFTEIENEDEFPSKEEKQAIRIKTVLHFRNLMDEGLIKSLLDVA